MRASVLIALLLTGSCAKVEFDIRRAKFRADMGDLVQGRDRGYFGYRKIIQDNTIKGPRSRHYQYVEPAHVANYEVKRAVRGLGGTEWPNTDYMAGSVDRLLYVLRHDPTARLRVVACSQLGRVAERLPAKAVDPYPLTALADENIRQIASDLYGLQQKMDEGEKVKQSLVVDSLSQLSEKYPTRFLLSLMLMRALSSKPVVLVPPGPVRDKLTEVVPGLCRRCISISLAEVGCGSRIHAKVRADESETVRLRAVEVLTMLRDPVARDLAADRLWDEVYPDESDVHVRRALLNYLGVVGGPRAFEAAVRRLDNDDISLRLNAQEALIAMTGARLEPKPAAWRQWRVEHPEWQMLPGPDSDR
jgi:hypothetical protein